MPNPAISPGKHIATPLILELGFWKALNVVIKLLRLRGEEIPPAFKYARDTRELRELHRLVKKGEKPHSVLGLAKNEANRLFIDPELDPELESRRAGEKEQSFLKHLIGDLPLDIVIWQAPVSRSGGLEDISLRKWRDWLRSSGTLDERLTRILQEMDTGETHSGPGLGIFSERRVGIALSIACDNGKLQDFAILGDGGGPLQIEGIYANEDTEKHIDYSAHDETMAIDVIAQLNPSEEEQKELFDDPSYEYALVQVKSSSGQGCGYDTKVKQLKFTEENKQEFLTLLPEYKDSFILDTNDPDLSYLPVERNVFKLTVSHRKLAKVNEKDRDPDIINSLLCAFEKMQEESETLILSKPYEDLTYAEKVAELIKQGFLKLNLDDGVNTAAA